MQITALEQLKEEMQEELFQQSLEATKLHALNQQLTAQLAKADDRNTSMQASIAALTDDKLKVTSQFWVVTNLQTICGTLTGSIQLCMLCNDTMCCCGDC